MSTPTSVNIDDLLKRITYNPEIYGGKAIIRGRRLAVEHVLRQLALGDTPETLLEGWEWLEREDILACIAYAYSVIANERFMPTPASAPAAPCPRRMTSGGEA
jgi:uncharacterized protein (DUF433 family)